MLSRASTSPCSSSQPQPDKGLNDIYKHEGKPEKFDLKQYVYITEAGRQYLQLLNQLSDKG